MEANEIQDLNPETEMESEKIYVIDVLDTHPFTSTKGTKRETLYLNFLGENRKIIDYKVSTIFPIKKGDIIHAKKLTADKIKVVMVTNGNV